jgi:hypothetical protein
MSIAENVGIHDLSHYYRFLDRPIDICHNDVILNTSACSAPRSTIDSFSQLPRYPKGLRQGMQATFGEEVLFFCRPALYGDFAANAKRPAVVIAAGRV